MINFIVYLSILPTCNSLRTFNRIKEKTNIDFMISTIKNKSLKLEFSHFCFSQAVESKIQAIAEKKWLISVEKHSLAIGLICNDRKGPNGLTVNRIKTAK